jgi:hypothetical protein
VHVGYRRQIRIDLMLELLQSLDAIVLHVGPRRAEIELPRFDGIDVEDGAAS